MPVSSPYPRQAKPLLIEALADSPVVLVHGPRQCGKTTLERAMSPAPRRAPGRMQLLGGSIMGAPGLAVQAGECSESAGAQTGRHKW